MKVIVEYEPESVVNLICNSEGADFLIELLQKLRSGGHDHLMTESWGGWELSDVPAEPPTTQVHQFNVFVEPAADE